MQLALNMRGISVSRVCVCSRCATVVAARRREECLCVFRKAVILLPLGLNVVSFDEHWALVILHLHIWCCSPRSSSFLGTSFRKLFLLLALSHFSSTPLSIHVQFTPSPAGAVYVHCSGGVRTLELGWTYTKLGTTDTKAGLYVHRS